MENACATASNKFIPPISKRIMSIIVSITYAIYRLLAVSENLEVSFVTVGPGVSALATF